MPRVGGVHKTVFHLNHQFLGIITQLKSYFDAFSQLYILHFNLMCLFKKELTS